VDRVNVQMLTDATEDREAGLLSNWSCIVQRLRKNLGSLSPTPCINPVTAPLASRENSTEPPSNS
jgi:hypothetical protein